MNIFEIKERELGLEGRLVFEFAEAVSYEVWDKICGCFPIRHKRKRKKASGPSKQDGKCTVKVCVNMPWEEFWSDNVSFMGSA